MNRALAALALFLVSACSGSPVAPAPTPSTVTISGTVSATNGGQALAGAQIDAAGKTVATDGAGHFTVDVPSGRYALMISGAGLLPHVLTLDASASRSAAVNAITQTGGFDLGFYRQFVRNGKEAPASLEPLRRWTTNPNIYIRTVDDAGTPIPTGSLDVIAAVISADVPTWTAGQFSVASMQRGSGTMAGVSGWLTVTWPTNLAASVCGQSQVGTDGGTIKFPSPIPSFCKGNDRNIQPWLVQHELGHAMGFWHTDGPDDLMNPGASTFRTEPSARERYHAAIAYQRPVGNRDPDSDP